MMMTPDEMIAVIQAHKMGNKIEVKANNTRGWKDYPYTEFFPNFDEHVYRVKPQSREWWLGRSPRGHWVVFSTDPSTSGDEPPAEVVHVLEVLCQR